MGQQESKAYWLEHGETAKELAGLKLSASKLVGMLPIRADGWVPTRSALISFLRRKGIHLPGGHSGIPKPPKVKKEGRALLPRSRKWASFRPEDLQTALGLEPLGPEDDIPAGHACRYTSDDTSKRGWRMCGRPGHPWCDHHRAVVYTAQKEPA